MDHIHYEDANQTVPWVIPQQAPVAPDGESEKDFSELVKYEDQEMSYFEDLPTVVNLDKNDLLVMSVHGGYHSCNVSARFGILTSKT